MTCCSDDTCIGEAIAPMNADPTSCLDRPTVTDAFSVVWRFSAVKARLVGID